MATGYMTKSHRASVAEPIQLELVVVPIDWFRANIAAEAELNSVFDQMNPSGLRRLEVYDGGELLALYYDGAPDHVRILTKKPSEAMWNAANSVLAECAGR